MVEEWKVISGYESYEVSTHGRVRTYRDRGGHFTGVPRIMSLKCAGDGGYSIALGRSYRISIHALVLTTFIGPRPDGYECRHLDGNPANNRLDNLCWGTKSENYDDRRRHGKSGGVHTQHKLNDDIVRIIRSSEKTIHELAHMFNVSALTIHRAKIRQTWTHVK